MNFLPVSSLRLVSLFFYTLCVYCPFCCFFTILPFSLLKELWKKKKFKKEKKKERKGKRKAGKEREREWRKKVKKEKKKCPEGKWRIFKATSCRLAISGRESGPALAFERSTNKEAGANSWDARDSPFLVWRTSAAPSLTAGGPKHEPRWVCIHTRYLWLFGGISVSQKSPRFSRRIQGGLYQWQKALSHRGQRLSRNLTTAVGLGTSVSLIYDFLAWVWFAVLAWWNGAPKWTVQNSSPFLSSSICRVIVTLLLGFSPCRCQHASG